MARIARVVAPGVPHHVVQRGVRRMRVFFSDEDRRVYLRILHDQAARFGLQIWAYCLMDNHVHMVVVPEQETSLARAIGETHRRYTLMVNTRQDWKGYLWQGRFQSYVLDEAYLHAVVRYVEQNPIKAGIVQKAEDYRWSSARSRIHKTQDTILSDFFLTSQIENWAEFLQNQEQEDDELLEQHLKTGRPMGGHEFVGRLETSLGRILHKRKPGRKINRD